MTFMQTKSMVNVRALKVLPLSGQNSNAAHVTDSSNVICIFSNESKAQ